MSDRPGMVVGDREDHVQGPMLQVAAPAPDFVLTANDWSKKSLANYAGKVKILSVVPSLDTVVCSVQTHRFNDEASSLGNDVVILTISTDLPYAQWRWCGLEGVKRVETLSDHYDMNFSNAYGVHNTVMRICQRAVFVVDKNDVIQLAEYIHIIGDEINYDAAVSKARELV
jgi:thiol peroxidase